VRGTDEIVVDRDDGVRRHGKADALVAGRLRVDRGVDTDDLPVHVDQRTAGVSGIDRRIRLNEVLELALRALIDGPVLGRDDAGGDRLRKFERLADGDDPLADLGAVGVAHLYRG
jgi:hypothetical protein